MTRFRLHEVLKAEGMTQYRLTKVARVNFSTVQRIYHNKTRQVSLDVLDAIAAALGVSVGELFETKRSR